MHAWLDLIQVTDLSKVVQNQFQKPVPEEAIHDQDIASIIFHRWGVMFCTMGCFFLSPHFGLSIALVKVYFGLIFWLVSIVWWNLIWPLDSSWWWEVFILKCCLCNSALYKLPACSGLQYFLPWRCHWCSYGIFFTALRIRLTSPAVIVLGQPVWRLFFFFLLLYILRLKPRLDTHSCFEGEKPIQISSE